jgi:hemolysin III
MLVDLQGNLVFQEVMNCLTHGMGILLCVLGGTALSNRVRDRSSEHVWSCAVYSISLLCLYVSSTLYHSFFAFRTTKHVFAVMDKCAIYILIAGSYTPFLRIALVGHPLWSVWLLAFIWACCICGMFVEAFFHQWKYKGHFSLAMYLGMGWSCMVCLPELIAVLPQGAISLLVLGGVGYTSGVPFFVRNNNLDHSIWHCFVLAGSMFHWLAIFHYIVRLP